RDRLGERLLDLPLNAKLTLPARGVETYPELIRPQDLLGEIGATGSLSGSIRKPAVTVALRGRGVRPATQTAAFPVDVAAQAASTQAVGVVRIAKGGIVASASLDQASGGGSATATARVKWTSPLFPELDTKEPLDIYCSARDLRAAVLYPALFRGIFTYFDGA